MMAKNNKQSKTVTQAKTKSTPKTKAKPASGKKIDFDKALLKGRKCYDQEVGEWWDSQSTNAAHQKAYKNVCDHVAKRLKAGGKSSPFIVDYGCGNGFFLSLLAQRLPQARIVALDGSKKMLKLAEARLEKLGIEAGPVSSARSFDAQGPRIRLVQCQLPNFKLPAGKADAVIFLFPNITFSSNDQDEYDRNGYKNRKDVALCTVLARLREMDPEDEIGENVPQEQFDSLMTDRVIARNIRRTLRQGGTWIKVDYANAAREELSELTRWRTLFSEGALDKPIKGMTSERFFEYGGNAFFRSTVIMDVFHQTQDPSDKTGGYFISAFKAI